MKKNYQKPSMDVIDIKIQHSLLVGSGTKTSTFMSFGDEAGDEDEGE